MYNGSSLSVPLPLSIVVVSLCDTFSTTIVLVIPPSTMYSVRFLAVFMVTSLIRRVSPLGCPLTSVFGTYSQDSVKADVNRISFEVDS